MFKARFLAIISLSLSLTLLQLMACATTSTPPPPPPPPDDSCASDAICLSVSGVGAGSECDGNLYAAIYADFDGTHDPSNTNVNQVALNDCSGTSPRICSGKLQVGGQIADAPVFVYCDTSQGEFSYDRNGAEGNIADGLVTLVPYSNTANFNACPRAMVQQPDLETDLLAFYLGSLSYPENFFFANTTVQPPPDTTTTTQDPYKFVFGAVTTENEGVVDGESGDRFTFLMEDTGTDVLVNLTDLSSLPGSGNHPALEGNLRTWCNCIFGTNMYAEATIDAKPSTVTGTLAFLINTFTTGTTYTTPNFYGFFTDKDRADGNPPPYVNNLCVIP